MKLMLIVHACVLVNIALYVCATCGMMPPMQAVVGSTMGASSGGTMHGNFSFLRVASRYSECG